jgi:hypothetical protein
LDTADAAASPSCRAYRIDWLNLSNQWLNGPGFGVESSQPTFEIGVKIKPGPFRGRIIGSLL